MGSNELERPGQLRLNFDVLRLICNDLANVSDVLSFALTCSILRKGALQRRLRMSSVVLSGPDSVERFHKFIFADPTSRAPYLYGITLSPKSDYAPNGDPRFENCLAAILEAATRIEHLDFPTTFGDTFCSALVKINTLRELVVTFSSGGGADDPKLEAFGFLITALRSPLRYLWIGEQGQLSLDFVHSHLSQFAPTLKSLRLGDLHLNVDSFFVSTPFTAMRSLHLASVGQYTSYRLDVLLRLFPNLDDTISLRGFMALTPDEHLALREENKEAQKAYTWAGLHRVTYEVELAFTMALQCPIRCMEINGLGLREAEAAYLEEVLRDNCPQRLRLPLAVPDHETELQTLLDRLFPPEMADRLTHLVLFIHTSFNLHACISGECNKATWGLFIDELVESMKHLHSLTHLRIVFQYDIFPLPYYAKYKSPRSRPNAPNGREDFAQNIAHDADLHPAAIRLLDRLPALEYMFLTTCGVRRTDSQPPLKYWYSSRAWQVREGVTASGDVNCDPLDQAQTLGTTESRTRRCVEISGDAAAAVIKEEELHLSEWQEKEVQKCLKSG